MEKILVRGVDTTCLQYGSEEEKMQIWIPFSTIILESQNLGTCETIRHDAITQPFPYQTRQPDPVIPSPEPQPISSTQKVTASNPKTKTPLLVTREPKQPHDKPDHHPIATQLTNCNPTQPTQSDATQRNPTQPNATQRKHASQSNQKQMHPSATDATEANTTQPKANQRNPTKSNTASAAQRRAAQDPAQPKQSNGLRWVALGFVGFASGCTGLRWVALGCFGVLGCVGWRWALFCCVRVAWVCVCLCGIALGLGVGLLWVQLGCVRMHWVASGCVGLGWASLGCAWLRCVRLL